MVKRFCRRNVNWIEDLGIFLFSDEDDSLGLRNKGLTNLNVQALTLDNECYVYACTENGVWRRPLSEFTPGEENQIPITSSFNLHEIIPIRLTQVRKSVGSCQ